MAGQMIHTRFSEISLENYFTAKSTYITYSTQNEILKWNSTQNEIAYEKKNGKKTA